MYFLYYLQHTNVVICSLTNAIYLHKYRCDNHYISFSLVKQVVLNLYNTYLLQNKLYMHKYFIISNKRLLSSNEFKPAQVCLNYINRVFYFIMYFLYYLHRTNIVIYSLTNATYLHKLRCHNHSSSFAHVYHVVPNVYNTYLLQNKLFIHKRIIYPYHCNNNYILTLLTSIFLQNTHNNVSQYYSKSISLGFYFDLLTFYVHING